MKSFAWLSFAVFTFNGCAGTPSQRLPSGSDHRRTKTGQACEEQAVRYALDFSNRHHLSPDLKVYTDTSDGDDYGVALTFWARDQEGDRGQITVKVGEGCRLVRLGPNESNPVFSTESGKSIVD